MGDFGQLAPWVISVITLILGWILRWWYDEGKFSEYNDRIEAKDRDIYHLNEAHNLLLQDKKTKISGSSDELAMKDRVIAELTAEVKQLKSSQSNPIKAVVKPKTSKKSPSKSVQKTSKKDITISALSSTNQPVSIVSKIDKKAKKKKGRDTIQQIAGANSPDHQDQKQTKIWQASVRTGAEGPSKPLSKKERLKKKLHRSQQKVKTLRSKNSELVKQLSSESKAIAKEAPITITKTILVKEKIDRKKLKKALKNIPFKKTRKVSSEVTGGPSKGS